MLTRDSPCGDAASVSFGLLAQDGFEHGHAASDPDAGYCGQPQIYPPGCALSLVRLNTEPSPYPVVLAPREFEGLLDARKHD